MGTVVGEVMTNGGAASREKGIRRKKVTRGLTQSAVLVAGKLFPPAGSFFSDFGVAFRYE